MHTILFENLKARAEACITREIHKVGNSVISAVQEAHKVHMDQEIEEDHGNDYWMSNIGTGPQVNRLSDC
jgi:hypothetical protein